MRNQEGIEKREAAFNEPTESWAVFDKGNEKAARGGEARRRGGGWSRPEDFGVSWGNDPRIKRHL